MSGTARLGLGCFGLLVLLSATAAFAQSPEDFYKGKQINLLIGGGAGGGYDVYYRAFARHVAKHIPGHPAIIPRNVPATLASASALRRSRCSEGNRSGAGV